MFRSAAVLILHLPVLAQAQTPRDSTVADTAVMIEVMPQFPGGEQALHDYMVLNLRYPEACLEAGIQGKVWVEFTVRKDGSVADGNVVRGAHPMLDAEALRVVNSMPAWQPGTINGKPVPVRYNVPVSFKIDPGKKKKGKKKK